MSDVREMPVFPLSLVLLPGTVLPLHLFEPRYLEMYSDIVDGARDFSVVLIERGNESGGDDDRFGFGCVTHMLGSATHEDGRVSIATVGTHRVRIVDWLEPDPYPRAVVEILPESELSEEGEQMVGQATEKLRTLNALLSELGADVGSDLPDLSADPAESLYQIAQLAGLQLMDLQSVLEVETSDQRARLLGELLDDQIELVRLQLALG